MTLPRSHRVIIGRGTAYERKDGLRGDEERPSKDLSVGFYEEREFRSRVLDGDPLRSGSDPQSVHLCFYRALSSAGPDNDRVGHVNVFTFLP